MTNKTRLKEILKDIQSKTFGEGEHYDAQNIKKATSAIQYDCQFKDGKCKNSYWNNQSPRCCCLHCAKYQGYLGEDNINTLPLNSDKEIIPLFDEKLGFWREGVGCTLPRKYRSYVCLSYNCHSEGAITNGIRQMLLYALEYIYYGRGN